MSESPNKLKFCLTSIKNSAFESKTWYNVEKAIIALLSSKGMQVKLLVRIFGKDEIWCVSVFRELNQLSNLRRESCVIYNAVLTQTVDINQEIINEIIEKNLPKAYVFLRTDLKEPEKIARIVKENDGSSFLIGAIDHPTGYNYFIALTNTSDDISHLNRVIFNIAQSAESEKWEGQLGADHWWLDKEEVKQKTKVQGIKPEASTSLSEEKKGAPAKKLLKNMEDHLDNDYYFQKRKI